MPFVNGRWVDYYPGNPVQNTAPSPQQTAPAQAVQPAAQAVLQGTGAQRYGSAAVAPRLTPAQVFQQFQQRVKSLPANNPALNLGALLQSTVGIPDLNSRGTLDTSFLLPKKAPKSQVLANATRFQAQEASRLYKSGVLNDQQLRKFTDDAISREAVRVFEDTKNGKDLPPGVIAQFNADPSTLSAGNDITLDSKGNVIKAPEPDKSQIDSFNRLKESQINAAKERFYSSIKGGATGQETQKALNDAFRDVDKQVLASYVQDVSVQESSKQEVKKEKRGGFSIGDIIETVALGSNPITSPLAKNSPLGLLQNALFPGASGLEQSVVKGDVKGVIKNIPGAAFDVGTALIPGTGGAKVGSLVAGKTGSALLGKAASVAGGAALGSAVNSGGAAIYGQNPLKSPGNLPGTSIPIPAPAISGALIGGAAGGLSSRVPIAKGKVTPESITRTVSVPQASRVDISTGQKGASGLIENIKKSKGTSQELKSALKPQEYDVLPNKVTLDVALKDINKNPSAALNEVLSDAPRDPVLNAKGLILAEKAQKGGDFDLAQKIFQAMAPGNTRAGQTIQILSIWGKTTPNGVVKYAQKVVDDANNALVQAGKNPKLNVSPETLSSLRKTSEKINKMPDSREKLIATQKMLNDINDLVPSSLGTKLQSSLYYAQLLNPKTAIRNIGGNFGFGVIENVKDVVGAPIDAAITGARKLLGQDAKRTTYLPDPLMQMRAGISESKNAAQEIGQGVNLSHLEGQLQIGNKPRAFKGKVGTFLDRLLQSELSIPDRFSFGSREAQTLKNLMRAEGLRKPTQEMRDIARFDGMYVTFQDDSNAAKGFVALKKGLNSLSGGKDFGLGSFVLNYPKTPGNLLARGIDYSPAGFVKATLNIAKPLFRRGPFDQKAFVDNFSRALVGTAGLVGTGAILHRVGIITGAASKDKDVNSLDKATGLGAYRINLSALKRFVLSGFDPSKAKIRPGDSLINYDWFQPAAIGISMGANIDETKGTDKGSVGKLIRAVGSGGAALSGGIQTLAEQPLVTGVEKLTGAKSGGDITAGVMSVLQGIPASFIPTVLNQVNQLTDNTSRSTYDPNPINQAINQTKAKIPGLAQTLQPLINSLGQNVERYQGGTNNWFNVFLNPGFISKYQPTALTDEIKRLQDTTGEATQFPRLVDYNQKVNGKTQQLTSEQVTALQKYIGTKANDQLSKIISSPLYKNASDAKKVNILSSALTYIQQAGRSAVLGDKTKLNRSAQAILSDADIGLRSSKTSTGTKKAKAKKVKSGSSRVSYGRKKVGRKVSRVRVKKPKKPKMTAKKISTGKVSLTKYAPKKTNSSVLNNLLKTKKSKRTGVLASLGL